MYFTVEWPEEHLVGFLIAVEFVPLALVSYYREGLHPFFVEDKAIIAVFVSWVFHWYYVDMGVS